MPSLRISANQRYRHFRKPEMSRFPSSSTVTVRARRSAADRVCSIVSAWDSGHDGAVDGASDEAALDGRREAVDLFSDDGTGCFGGPGCAALRDEREHGLRMAA